MISAEISVDIWTQDDPSASCICIKRSIDLPFAPYPELKVRLEKTGDGSNGHSKEACSKLRSIIQNKTGVFRIQSVSVDAGTRGVVLRCGISEKTSEAAMSAADYFCKCYGFKRFPSDDFYG